jgi:hypothetical protein
MVAASQSGKLVRNADASLFITNAQQTSLDMFQQTFVGVGCGGAGVEKGGLAMKTAVALSGPGGHNEGFVREGANFAAIFLTDEDDDSMTNQTSPPLSAQEIVEAAIAAKGGDPDKVFLHLIAHLTDNDGCFNNAGDQKATGYLQQLDYLKDQRSDGYAGERVSICTQDYSNIIPTLIEQSTTFKAITFIELDKALGYVPEPTSIRLIVDNLVITNEPQNYTYDAATNRLILVSEALKQPGVTGEICAYPKGLGEV